METIIKRESESERERERERAQETESKREFSLSHKEEKEATHFALRVNSFSIQSTTTPKRLKHAAVLTTSIKPTRRSGWIAEWES